MKIKSVPKKNVPMGRYTVYRHPYLEHQVEMKRLRRQEQERQEEEAELRRLELQQIHEEANLRRMQRAMEIAEMTPRQRTNRIIDQIARRMFANPIYPSDSDSLGNYEEE
jgi:hypothetical protein